MTDARSTRTTPPTRRARKHIRKAAPIGMAWTMTALGLVLMAAPIATATTDPFDQRSFPCQEDEVLGYAPQFGPDRVGCIHIEDVTR